MRLGSFFAVFCNVSFAFAVDSSIWGLRSFLRRVSAPDPRLVTRTIPTGWTSVGCATDGAARALSYSYTSTSLTQDSCVASCDSKGYTYAGLEYGQECWCGNSLANNLGVATASSDCNMACSGNSNQICGAGFKMTLFRKTLSSGWSLSQACAVDTSSRLLQGYSGTSSSNTPSSCQATCAAKGYKIAGVEYGNECYCANAISGTATAASPSDCNVACTGNSALKCGAGWRLQIYTYSSTLTTTTTTTSVTTPTTSATTTPATTTTASAASTTTTSWVLSNPCAVDTSSRILQGYSGTNSSNTPSSCQSTCGAKGFSIAGVEYGNECYCANAISGTPTAAPASDCNVACPGDSTLKCGAGWRIQIYTATMGTTAATTSSTTPTSTSISTTTTTTAASTSTMTSWVLSNPCAVDTSTRILRGYGGTNPSNTPSSCQATCLGKGFSIAGVEYGNECYCANAISGTAPAPAASVSDCNVSCAGNSTLMCGGSWRLQIYTATTITVTDTSTAAATTTTTTATTTTTTAIPIPTETSLADGWTLSRPCAVDPPAARVLAGYTYTSPLLTPAACQLACAGKGFSIAGVENGDACFCGNAYLGGAPADANANATNATTTMTDCTLPCTGNASFACGGLSRITLFTSTGASISDIWQTSWDKSTLLAALNLPPINFTTAGPIADADITVDETIKYQSMDGFGASLTDSSATLLANLKSTNSTNYYTLLHQLFDVTDGSYSAMSSVLRIPLGATDFSDTVYSYCDTPGDTSFSSFDINRTPAPVWLVLHDILAINRGIKIYVTPWSPPGWMKDSNSMLGGSLKANYVAIYPKYLLKALQGFQSKGVSVYAIAIQNEPQYSTTGYPSASIPVETEATIGKALRTLMDSNGFGTTKILGFDHNFSGAATYAVQLMQQAPTAFAGAAFHCYSGTVGAINNFTAAFPDKEVHLTECSGVYGSDWWGDIKGYTDGLFVGGPDHGARSSMMWNLALNGTGRPMLPGATSCGTPCRGVVQINADGTWSANQEFWPIAHAGKAIAPRDAGGAFGQRIGVSVRGTYYWALRVNAYATARLSATDKTRYSLIVLNWRDNVNNSFVPTPQPTTINFRGVQATYVFPVGLTTLSWYA